MNTKRKIVLAVPIVASGLALLASCMQLAKVATFDHSTELQAANSSVSPPRETITIAADEPIPNLPGKRLVSHIVDYPPGGGSAPHHHARSAFIYAYVLSGQIKSQVNDGPSRVYRAGETWFESPGSHHRVSVNASDTEPARLLAVIIVDASDKQVTTPDPQ